MTRSILSTRYGPNYTLGVLRIFLKHRLQTTTLESGVIALDQYSNTFHSFVKCLTQNGVVKTKYLKYMAWLHRESENTREEAFLLVVLRVSVLDCVIVAIGHLASYKSNFLKAESIGPFALVGPDGAGKTTISDRLIF